MTKYLKIATVFLALLTLAIFSLELFKVKSIDLKESPCVDDQDLNIRGKIIFTVAKNKIEQELKDKFPCLSALNLKKVYPSTLKVEAVAAGPVAKVAHTQYATTIEGKIIDEGAGNQLPVLYLLTSVSTEGSQITDQSSLFAIKIASLLARTDFRLTTIRVLGEEIVAYDAKEVIAHFSSQKDATLQVDSLQQTLAAAKIDGDKIAKIDLRFDKPVITFK